MIGCTTDINDKNIAAGGSVTELTISTQPTRTSLGGKVDDTYPVYWSEGDRIVINGTLSEEAILDGENCTEAKFKVEVS